MLASAYQLSREMQITEAEAEQILQQKASQNMASIKQWYQPELDGKMELGAPWCLVPSTYEVKHSACIHIIDAPPRDVEELQVASKRSPEVGGILLRLPVDILTHIFPPERVIMALSTSKKLAGKLLGTKNKGISAPAVRLCLGFSHKPEIQIFRTESNTELYKFFFAVGQFRKSLWPCYLKNDEQTPTRDVRHDIDQVFAKLQHMEKHLWITSWGKRHIDFDYFQSPLAVVDTGVTANKVFENNTLKEYTANVFNAIPHKLHNVTALRLTIPDAKQMLAFLHDTTNPLLPQAPFARLRKLDTKVYGPIVTDEDNNMADIQASYAGLKELFTVAGGTLTDCTLRFVHGVQQPGMVYVRKPGFVLTDDFSDLLYNMCPTLKNLKRLHLHFPLFFSRLMLTELLPDWTTHFFAAGCISWMLRQISMQDEHRVLDYLRIHLVWYCQVRHFLNKMF